jgi:hypothetical protein
VSDDLDLVKVGQRVGQLALERDEARAAAREILLDSVSWDEPAYQKLCDGVWKAFPWLKEANG